MLRSDEHYKILQMLEREAPQFGRDSAGADGGVWEVSTGGAAGAPGVAGERRQAEACPTGGPASSLRLPASRILDLPDVPDLLSLPVEPIQWLVESMIPRAAVTPGAPSFPVWKGGAFDFRS